ncbi:MAG: 2-phospho-L-lactate guanylyltransferase [Candidatus Tectomicrobia bacterium]|uniref:2-phospho-L-lactate guanylyltransferase n=1 Tax=Tectimicrobiota bacterium TaxID=2528274 RepID=A0A932MP91_UNCTE|nr:2-phospho-L-lactate guanylyltransferase [Candidatus Tectomicrobia bacterium]
MAPCTALIPARDFRTAKRRLAAVLSAEARDGLGRWMLGRVLDALEGAAGVERVAVLSDSPEVLALAGARGAAGLRCPALDLNADLERGRAWAIAQGAGTVFVVPADLPFLQAADAERLLAADREEGCAVLAPSPDGGTNALLLRPADAMPFAFGPGSFARHLALAEARGLRALRLDSPGFVLDVDLPADLAALAEAGAPLPAGLAGAARTGPPERGTPSSPLLGDPERLAAWGPRT